MEILRFSLIRFSNEICFNHLYSDNIQLIKKIFKTIIYYYIIHFKTTKYNIFFHLKFSG